MRGVEAACAGPTSLQWSPEALLPLPGGWALTYSQTKVPSGMSCRGRTPQPMFCVR